MVDAPQIPRIRGHRRAARDDRLREVESTNAHGRALGLTSDEIGQVVLVHTDVVGGELMVDWPTVREALSARARGEDWRG